ncbi:hypothetical protein E4U32_000892 [Claviceps aff. humidiphila group G2b]|nr:hypothetical protein E4U32_000892 [Claviceps aff. humidiphila group G2b]
MTDRSANEAQLSTATSTASSASTDTMIRRVTPQQARVILQRRRRRRESIPAGVTNGASGITLRREAADGALMIILYGNRLEWDPLDAEFPEEDVYQMLWRSRRGHARRDETNFIWHLSD